MDVKKARNPITTAIATSAPADGPVKVTTFWCELCYGVLYLDGTKVIVA